MRAYFCKASVREGVWLVFICRITGLCGERGSCGIHVPSMSLEIRGQERWVWTAGIKVGEGV